jgi:large subunit ribosomal protein L4
MIKVPVVNPEGQEVGSLELDPADFGGDVNKQLLHDAVVMYQANQRAGTHKTKTRSEIAGSGKKLFRQKGTGNARQGSKRTHKRRGGGTVFGPKPRDYSYMMPLKARRLATRMALLSKFQDHEAVVVDGLAMTEVKTQRMAALLDKLQVRAQGVLIATKGIDKNVYLSGRNIERVTVLPAEQLNAYELLRRKRLLISKEALTDLAAKAKAGRAARKPRVAPQEAQA